MEDHYPVLMGRMEPGAELELAELIVATRIGPNLCITLRASEDFTQEIELVMDPVQARLFAKALLVAAG